MSESINITSTAAVNYLKTLGGTVTENQSKWYIGTDTISQTNVMGIMRYTIVSSNSVSWPLANINVSFSGSSFGATVLNRPTRIYYHITTSDDFYDVIGENTTSYNFLYSGYVTSTASSAYINNISVTLAPGTNYLYVWAAPASGYGCWWGGSTSSTTTFTGTRNSDPTITATTQTKYTAQGGDGDTTGSGGYRMGWVRLPSFVVNTSETFQKVRVTLQASNGTATTALTSFGLNVTVGNYDILTGASSVAVNNVDVESAIKNTSLQSGINDANIYYRFKVEIVGSNNPSQAVYYPANGYYFALSKTPAVYDKHNQHSNSNVSGASTTSIYRNLRVRTLKDTSGNAPTVTATDGTTTWSGTATLTAGSTYDVYDITLADGITSEAELTINLVLSHTNGYSRTIVVTGYHEVKQVNLSSYVSTMPTTFFPFTDTGNYTFTIDNPFDGETSASSLTNYAISGSSYYKLYLRSASADGTQTLTIGSGALTTSLLVGTISAADVFTFDHSFLSITKYSTSKTIQVGVRIINNFGQVFTSETQQFTFNFRSAPTTNLAINITSGSTTYNTMVEGLTASIVVSGKWYTEEQHYITAYQSQDGVQINKVTARIAEGVNNNGRSGVSYSKTITYTIPAITSNSDIETYYTIAPGSSVVVYGTSATVTKKVVSYADPGLSLTSSQGGQTSLTVNYSCSSLGYASGSNLSDTLTVTQTATIYNDDTTTSIFSVANPALVAGNNSWVNASGYNQSGTISANITTTVKLNNNTVLTKVFSTNSIRPDLNLPTVAYRQGALGINTATVTSEAVLNIYSTVSRHEIVIEGTTYSSSARDLVYDMGDGRLSMQMANSTDYRVIDFNTGTFENFDTGQITTASIPTSAIQSILNS